MVEIMDQDVRCKLKSIIRARWIHEKSNVSIAYKKPQVESRPSHNSEFMKSSISSALLGLPTPNGRKLKISECGRRESCDTWHNEAEGRADTRTVTGIQFR
jgi:hypothetical protein